MHSFFKTLTHSDSLISFRTVMHFCFKMLNSGRRKLNTTATQLSSFTHNNSKLFPLISNDVTKPTVQNTSQLYKIQVSQESQNLLKMLHWMLIPTMDGNNIRGEEQEQGVENVVKAGSGFRDFPFACRDCLRCGETPPADPTWRHDAESISLTDLDSAELFWVYFSVTCFSFRGFTLTFLAFAVGSLYFHNM